MNHRYLDAAHKYALENSGCCKVQVGSLIVSPYRCDTPDAIIYGSNITLPCVDSCIVGGCLRIHKHGDDDKTHRSDCRAVHSEIDAIIRAARRRIHLYDSTIYITRYPCEQCARAIVLSGIRKVVYGRTQPISEETHQIFDSAGIYHIWEKGWTADDKFN